MTVRPPLDTSLAVRKLFTDPELQRIRRFIERRPRLQFIHPAPTVPQIRWPEWVAALAAVGALAVSLSSTLLSAHPRVQLGVLIFIALPGYFWLLGQIRSRRILRRYSRELQLDQGDALLACAAALVRAAELVRELITSHGQGPSLGALEVFAHGPDGPRIQQMFRDGYAAADDVASMLLVRRPPLDAELLRTWGGALRDRVALLHRGVRELIPLARSLTVLPHEQHLASGEAAYELYKAFWQQFATGSGIPWPDSDPLAPHADEPVPTLRFPLPVK